MEDDRGGLPSGSSVERLINCPGSMRKEASMPPEAEQPSEVRDQGKRIHRLLETEEEDEEAPLDEKTIAERLKELEKDAIKRWKQDHQIANTMSPLREERLWIRDRQTLVPLVSGQLDVACVAAHPNHEHAVIIDAKTGYLRPTEAPSNWQLRTYALALWHEFPQLTRIRVAIAQHRFRSLLDPCDYSLEDLQMAESLLLKGLWYARQDDAPFNPGPWCRYCKAAGDCVAAASYATVAVSEVQKHGLVTQLSPEVLKRIWERSTVAQAIFKKVAKRLKELPAEQLGALGLELKANQGNREIGDLQQLFEILHRQGLVTAESFRAMCQIGIGTVEETCVKPLAAKLDITQKAAEEQLNNLLAPIITRKPKEPSLVRKTDSNI